MNEKAIIQGCIDNNRVSQEKLYRYYFSKMISMCYRYTSDQETALTIVNDGFLKVFKKIDTYSHQGSFEGWIRRIVFHSISDYFRKENKYLKFMVFEEREKVLDTNAENQLYYEDLIKLVDNLPGKSKDVFTLFAIEGYSHKDIGKQLGISEGTSKWHLSEARKLMKKLIKQEEDIFLEHHGR